MGWLPVEDRSGIFWPLQIIDMRKRRADFHLVSAAEGIVSPHVSRVGVQKPRISARLLLVRYSLESPRINP